MGEMVRKLSLPRRMLGFDCTVFYLNTSCFCSTLFALWVGDELGLAKVIVLYFQEKRSHCVLTLEEARMERLLGSELSAWGTEWVNRRGG